MLQPRAVRRQDTGGEVLSSRAAGQAQAAGVGRDTIRPRGAHGRAGRLDRYYRRLLEELGPQGWWPGQTRLEVILGAILTQNTNWRNAASAIRRLRSARVLSVARLRDIPEARLRTLIRPAGFYRQKAHTIRTFVLWLDATYRGSLRRMFASPPDPLRTALLRLRGLGPETVDAILLYAGAMPFFVSDAYVRRILARHGFLAGNATYFEAQDFVQRNLERRSETYNEFHALLVEVGKRHCKRRAPECSACPLEEYLPAKMRPEAGQRAPSGAA